MSNAGADYTAQLRSLMQTVGIASFRALSQAASVSERQIDRLRKGEIAEMRLAVLIRLSQTLQRPIETLIQQFSDPATTHQGLDPSSDQVSDYRRTDQPLDQHPNQHSNQRTDQLSESEVQPPLTPTAHLLAHPPTHLPANALIQDASEKVAHSSPGEIEQLRQEYQRLQSQLEQQRLQLQQEFQQTSLHILESWLLFYPAAAYAAQQKPDAPAVKLLPLMRPIEQLIKSWGVEMVAPVGAEVPFDPQYHQLEAGTANPGDPVRIRKPGYRHGNKLLHRAKVTPVEPPPT